MIKTNNDGDIPMLGLSESDFAAWRNRVNFTSFFELNQGSNIDEYVFRIPIGDYRLQLDYRIECIIKLLIDRSSNCCVFRKHAYSDCSTKNSRLSRLLMLAGAYDRAIWTTDYDLIFLLLYASNRWSVFGEGMYVATKDAEIVIYQPGNSTTLFVIAKDAGIHDVLVADLRKIGVPAIGPHIVEPLEHVTYSNYEFKGDTIKVNPLTGKLEGLGSELSVLQDCFLPASLRGKMQ